MKYKILHLNKNIADLDDLQGIAYKKLGTFLQNEENFDCVFVNNAKNLNELLQEKKVRRRFKKICNNKNYVFNLKEDSLYNVLMDHIDDVNEIDQFHLKASNKLETYKSIMLNGLSLTESDVSALDQDFTIISGLNKSVYFDMCHIINFDVGHENIVINKYLYDSVSFNWRLLSTDDYYTGTMETETCIDTALAKLDISISDLQTSKHVNLSNIKDESESISNYSQFYSEYLTHYYYKNSQNIFQALYQSIFTTRATKKNKSQELSSNQYLVYGKRGIGKSSFMTVMYRYTHLNYKIGSDYYPVYFNLNYYKESSTDLEEAEKQLREDIHLVEETYNNHDCKLFIMIDSVHYENSSNNELFYLLLDYVKSISKKNDIKIMISALDISRETTYKIADTIRLDKLHFKLNIQSSEEVEVKVSKFLALNYIKPDMDEYDDIFKFLVEKVNFLGKDFVDIFTMDLLYKSYIKLGYGNDLNLNNIYKEFILSNSRGITKNENELINRLSEFTFAKYIQRKSVVPNADLLKLLNRIKKHESVIVYLVSHYILDNWKKKVDGQGLHNPVVFKYIYPYTINNFMKEYFVNNKELLSKTVEILKEISTEDEYYFGTLATYFIGRSYTKRNKINQVKLLEQLLEDQNLEKETLSDSKLFYARTIYISLISLGNRKRLYEYINKLQKYERASLLNRVFYKCYYCNIFETYDINNDIDKDENYKELMQIIINSLQNSVSSEENLLVDVSIYTVINIIQENDFEFSRLGVIKRDVISILEKYMLRKKMPTNMKSQVDFVYECLQEDNFKSAYILKKLFELKSLERAGWGKRGISPAESIAGHSFGAVLLAEMFLGCSDKYDKEKIKNMLLIHDIAEAYIGDKTPDEKTEFDMNNEKYKFEQLSHLNSFKMFKGFTNIYDLWYEFQHGNSYEGRIAADIDHLDNLVQLYTYDVFNLDLEISNPGLSFEYWEKYLIDGFRTDIVREIGRYLKDVFNPDNNGGKSGIKKIT